jgi:hypothetical protein
MKHKVLNQRLAASAIIIGLFAFSSCSDVAAQDTPGPGRLDVQRSLNDNNLRIVIVLPEVISVSSTVFDLLRDTSFYEIHVEGGYGPFEVDTSFHPKQVGAEATFDLNTSQAQISDIKLDVGHVKAFGEVIRASVSVSDTVRVELGLANATVGPKELTLKELQGVSPFSKTMYADLDVSRLEMKDGALDYDISLGMYVSTFHVDIASEGTLFLGSVGDTAVAQPEGAISGDLVGAWLTGPVSVFGPFDLGAHLRYDYAPESDTRTASAGLNATFFPRLDRLGAVLATAMNGRTINFPPRLTVYGAYVGDIKDPQSRIVDESWRLGSEFDWRLELDENFYVKLQWKLTHYDRAPLTGNGDRDFSYLDLTGNFRLYGDLYLFMRYVDGELAPVYENDNVLTAGFRFDIRRRS